MENKTQYENLSANIDNSGKTPQLIIKGAVILYPVVKDVKLVKSYPQGINPKILLLELNYQKVADQMKGVSYPIDYSEVILTKDQYESFTIIHPDVDKQDFPIPYKSVESFQS